MNQFLGSDQEVSEGGGLGQFTSDHMSGHAGTILYVEDELFVREVMGEVLRTAGYQVLVAKNAAEAEDIFQGWGEEVDLLLTDVILPGETGCVLADRLRRKSPRLRVLYVTGYAEEMGMCTREGEDCLAKPFSTDALLQRVQRMIDAAEFLGGRESGAMLACAGA